MPKAKKAPPTTHEEYVFHIRKPSLSYHFGIEHDRKRRDWKPFDESETLNFVAECIWPDRLKDREAKVTLRPEPALIDCKLLDGDDVLRKQVGYIRATKGEFEIFLWLPPAVCWQLGEAMASGLVRSMLTNGRIEPLSMNRVIYVSFHGQEFDPAEYVG